MNFFQEKIVYSSFFLIIIIIKYFLRINVLIEEKNINKQLNINYDKEMKKFMLKKNLQKKYK